MKLDARELFHAVRHWLRLLIERWNQQPIWFDRAWLVTAFIGIALVAFTSGRIVEHRQLERDASEDLDRMLSVALHMDNVARRCQVIQTIVIDAMLSRVGRPSR